MIVEGVPAVERLLASPYRVRAVFGVPGRVAALDLPDDVAAYEADKWLLSEVIGFRLTRGVIASADAVRPRISTHCWPSPIPRRRAGSPCWSRSTTRRTWADRTLGARARHRRTALDTRCADPFYRRSVRVSMGHILALPFAVLSDWPGDLDRRARRRLRRSR